MEAWDISKQRIPRSFHLRPFIVLTITKRAHYKAKSEATCRVSVLKLVSPNQPDSQQLWGQSVGVRVRLRVRVRVADPHTAYSKHATCDRTRRWST